MTDSVVVLCTCANREDAVRIADTVVDRRAAACVNIIPGIESIYRWEGKVERASEFLLLMKTTSERFEALRDLISRIHPYETPEIVAVPIAEGAAKYLAWIREQV